MALADTARLLASLELKDAFSPAINKATRSLGKFDAKLDDSQGRAYKAGQQIGTGIKNTARLAAIGVGFLTTQVVAGVGQLVKLEAAEAQTNAALKSTKGVAGETADSIRKLAERYESLNATIDDKVIQSGENVLLTFTKIRKDAFEPALQAALDLNTAMGGGEAGLQKTILQVGKALQEPSKGLTALRKSGVSFSADQIKRIKSLEKEGKLYEAQKIILGELSAEFGGRFAAQGKTAEGTFAGIGDAVEDLQTTLARGLFPTIQRVLPKIQGFLADPTTIAGVGKLGDKIASLFSDANIKTGADALKGAFELAKSAAPAIEQAAVVTGRVLSTAVGVFKSLPPELQALVIGGLAINKLTGGLVTNVAGGLISAVLKQLVSGVVNVNGAVVNVVGAGGAVGAAEGLATKGGGVLASIGGAAGLATIVAGVAAVAGVTLLINAAESTKTPTVQADIKRFIPHVGLDLSKAGTQAQHLGKEADDAAVAISRMGTFGTHAGKALDDLAIGTQVTLRRTLKGLHAEEAKILGERTKDQDPTKHQFKIPQRTFIDTHTNSDAVKIATAFTKRFTLQPSSKYFGSVTKQTAALQSLQRLQARFVAKGDTASAAKISANIAHLRGAMHLDANQQKALTRPLNSSLGSIRDRIEDQVIKNVVTVNSSLRVNGRVIESAIDQYRTTVQQSQNDRER